MFDKMSSFGYIRPMHSMKIILVVLSLTAPLAQADLLEQWRYFQHADKPIQNIIVEARNQPDERLKNAVLRGGIQIATEWPPLLTSPNIVALAMNASSEGIADDILREGLWALILYAQNLKTQIEAHEVTSIIDHIHDEDTKRGLLLKALSYRRILSDDATGQFIRAASFDPALREEIQAISSIDMCRRILIIHLKTILEPI